MRHHRLTSSEWEQVRTAYASGLGLREIARNMGIPAGTVLARSKREGWTRRIQAAKAIVPASPDAPALAVCDAAARSMAERGRDHVERVAGIMEKTLPHLEGMPPERLLDRVEDFDRLDRIARRTYGLDLEAAHQNTVSWSTCDTNKTPVPGNRAIKRNQAMQSGSAAVTSFCVK